MCKNEQTKPKDAHTRKHTTSCAKPWRHNNPAFTPLHNHLAIVFLPSFPSFPYSLWDVHICSYVGLSKGSPPCPKASTSNPRFLKKLARMQAFLVAYDKGLGWYWLLGLIPFKEWPFVLDVFWHAWVSIFGFSPCPESSSCTSLLSITPLCSDRGGALVF